VAKKITQLDASDGLADADLVAVVDDVAGTPATQKATFTQVKALVLATPTVTGKATFGSEVEIDGALNHDGSTVGFYNVTPVSRPAAYTQTYATATRTHSSMTSVAVATTAATQTTPWGYGSQAQADAIITAINALRTDVINVKGVVNSVVDDLQANGLLQ
jgi:hypothetical protein